MQAGLINRATIGRSLTTLPKLNRRTAMLGIGLGVVSVAGLVRCLKRNDDEPFVVTRDGPFQINANISLDETEAAFVKPKALMLWRMGSMAQIMTWFEFVGTPDPDQMMEVETTAFDSHGEIIVQRARIYSDQRLEQPYKLWNGFMSCPSSMNRAQCGIDSCDLLSRIDSIRVMFRSANN